MADAPVIEVRDLYKTYRDGILFRRSFEALKGISLQVHQQEIFGLLGPNGAGKTTLVKLLLGIVGKTRGDAQMLGRPREIVAVAKRSDTCQRIFAFPVITQPTALWISTGS